MIDDSLFNIGTILFKITFIAVNILFLIWLAALIPIGKVAGYFLIYKTVHTPDESQAKTTNKKEKNDFNNSVKIVTPENIVKAKDQSDVTISSLSTKKIMDKIQIKDNNKQF